MSSVYEIDAAATGSLVALAALAMTLPPLASATPWMLTRENC